MKQKRRRYSGALKAKVGLEALMGIKTTSQIAREHQVHPLLVTQWKRILQDRLPGIFERGPQAPDESEKTIAQLHQKIGQLTVDLDWLKKKCRQLGLSPDDER
jgi:transposase-like protein